VNEYLSDVMTSSKAAIQAVVQSARRTFSRKFQNFVLNSEEFSASLNELKTLLDGLRACDVGLDKSHALKSTAPSATAPVTYIKIHEDQDVSIGIFVVKGGQKIPLHNHPKMHGLLKVIYGKVDVSVFSKLKPHQIRQLDIPQVLRDKSHLIDQGFVFPSYREAFKSISEEHEALLLTPDDNNYHEICTVGEGHAAFFDILAPPYHTEVHEDQNEDLRECHFFSEISLPPNNNILIGLSNTDQNNSRQQPILHKRPPPHSVTPVWLRRVKSPDDYFCDTEPYLGPIIHAADD